MAQLSAVSVPASHRRDEPEQSQLPSDSEDEAGMDQNQTGWKDHWEVNDQANSLAVNTTVVRVDHAAQQHSRTEMMAVAISKEVSISEITDGSEHPPGTSFQDLQDGSGQVSAEASADTINQLALGKKTALPESSPQNLGKRKLQLAGDTPVSPSKRTCRERSHPEKSEGDTTVRGGEKRGNGQLKRPSRASFGKSTNNRSTMSSSKDIYAVGNMSPVENNQFSKSGPIGQGQTGVRTGRTAVRLSSTARNGGSGAEHAKSITTEDVVDHLLDPDLGSLPKPKGILRKQPQSTRDYNLRSGNADKSRDCSKMVGHNPDVRSSVSTSEPVVPSTKKRRNVGIKSGAPATVEPIRKHKAQIAERSAGEDSDSLDGSRISSEDGQETGGDLRVQLGRNEHAEDHDYDDDGTEDENVNKRDERVDVEAEDDIDCIDQPRVDSQQQVESTMRFLLRGHDWDKVLQGANSVGVSKVKNVTTKGKPQLETQAIKALVEQVRKISRIYKASGQRGELAPEVRELERQVDLIDEDKAGNKKCEIQDIYAHAIPKMVFMLDKALDAREADCSRPDHIRGLAEIIRLQDSVIRLCKKARDWKADPDTDRSIKKSTTQKIFPYLRSLRKTLSKELERRKRDVLSKKNEAAAELERKHREEEMRCKDLEVETERLAIWDKIKDQLDRNEMNVFRRKKSRPPSAIPALARDDWTEVQELVLNKYLEKYGHLPGEF